MILKIRQYEELPAVAKGRKSRVQKPHHGIARDDLTTRAVRTSDVGEETYSAWATTCGGQHCSQATVAVSARVLIDPSLPRLAGSRSSLRVSPEPRQLRQSSMAPFVAQDSADDTARRQKAGELRPVPPYQQPGSHQVSHAWRGSSPPNRGGYR